MYIDNEKIEKLKINKNNVYLVIDFDRTITSNEGLDSWAASARPDFVGKEIIKEMDELYEKYRPIELDYTIPEEEKYNAMTKWYKECMELYHKYNVTKEQLENSIGASDLRFRENMKELLIEINSRNIPIIILSAGIGNVIINFLNSNNCLFKENMYIISNFLEFDKNGNIQEFNNSKIIHSLNKELNTKITQEEREKIRGRKYKILIGDLIEDLKMVDSEEADTTLRIGILDKQYETTQKAKLYKEKFDMVTESISFCELKNMFDL